MRRSKSNLRPVRGITADTVRALLSLRHAGRDCAYLPLERTRLVDQVKGSVPPPCIDPRDVPATLRDDCDSYPSVPAEVARSFASKTIQATNGINGRKGRFIIDEFFDTPHVAQPAPSADCSDEARSAGPTEPTAPTTPTIEDQAYAAAVAKERRAGRAADRIERDRTDQGGRSGHAAGADSQAGRVSRPAGPGAAARAGRQDGVGEVPQPELKPTERKPLLGGDPLALRREALDRAIRFLKSRCVLVDVADRNAAIREYRVSGKRSKMLAEDVIEHAKALGMVELG